MPVVNPPVPVYPTAIDSNRTLFLVYNTTETNITVDNPPWSEEISITPQSASDAEIWSDNGFANISGELLYYDDVEKDGNGKVNKLKQCLRSLGGESTKFNILGTTIRSYVVAEHHNQIASTILNTEGFVGENFSTNQTTLDWRIRNLQAVPTIFDDFNCPDVNFTFNIVENDPSSGVLVEYSLQITGNFSTFLLQFGDGTSTTSIQSGTHRYSPNAKIDPVLILSNPQCQVVQTPITRTELQQPIGVLPPDPFEIPVPDTPEIPALDIGDVTIPDLEPQIPPIVFPCLEPIGPLSIPPVISIVPPINIPSIINFGPLDFPSLIEFGPLGIPSIIEFGPVSFDDISIVGCDLPTVINLLGGDTIPKEINILGGNTIPEFISVIGCDLPSSISFEGSLPTSISFIGDLPDTISIIEDIPSSISLVGTFPTAISIIEDIPTVISVAEDIPTTISVHDEIPEVISVHDEIPEVISVHDDIPTVISVAHDIPLTISVDDNIPDTISLVDDLHNISLIDNLPSSIAVDFGTAPTISVDFGEAPVVSVDWGTPPAISCSCVVECPTSSPAPFAAMGIEDGSDLDDYGVPNIEVDYSLQGIPSIIKIVPPDIPPEMKLVHELPAEISLKIPDIPELKIDASTIPSEIKIVPPPTETIVSMVTDMPKSIMVDASGIPDTIAIDMIKDIPSRIVVDGSDIPSSIKVDGIPDTIRIEHNIPKEIEVKMPDQPVIELAPIEPISVTVKLEWPTIPEDAENVQCVAIVPCPNK